MDKFIADFTANNKNFKLRQLNADELSGAELKYSAIFSKALREGVLTNAAMIKIMLEQKMWTEEEEKELREARTKVQELEKSFNDAKTPKKKEEFALSLRLARFSLNFISNKQTRMLNNTAESLADYEKLKYICFMSLTDDNGNRVFSTYDEFANANDGHPEIQEAIKLIMYKQAGVDLNAKNIEDKYLIEVGKMNDDGMLLDKNGKLIDEFGKLIDKNFRFVDESGYLINKDGKFVNKEGVEVKEKDKVLGDMPAAPAKTETATPVLKMETITPKVEVIPTNTEGGKKNAEGVDESGL